MKFFGKSRWVLVAVATLITATAGLVLGKMKEKNYLGGLYARTDFTLLDDKGEFFQLSKVSPSRLLLLIFTPDAIHPSLVRPFREFSGHLEDLKRLGIDVLMVTRTNREIARNFKEASQFSSRLLVDTSGSVGKNLGIWADLNPVGYWGYALIDNKMRVFWAFSESRPMSYDELIVDLKKIANGEVGAKPSSSTSSDSP